MAATQTTKRSNSGEDYISSLPDDVITKILSYVPTESATATSVLSRRWERVWTSTPNLDFGNYADSSAFDYADFVDRVLTCNSVSCVRHIRLHHYEHPDHHRVSAWMDSIVQRDAEVIDLHIVTKPMYRLLPDSFYTNKRNLVELNLSYWLCKVPRFVSFPSLRTIRLDHVHFEDDKSMKILLLGSPVLKNLYINFAPCVNTHTYDICSATLHVLHLCITSRQIHTNGCYNFVIDTPNLRDLDLVDHLDGNHNIVHVSSLVKMKLKFYTDDRMFMFKFLTNSPTFHSLIDLTLDIATKEQWESFPRLLRRVPSLVTLKLIMHDFHGPCVWHDPGVVPMCLSSCTESVEIEIYLYEPKEEDRMISYILKNASVLKKLSIKAWYSKFYYMDEEVENEDIEIALTLPRSSQSCQVYYQGVAILNAPLLSSSQHSSRAIHQEYDEGADDILNAPLLSSSQHNSSVVHQEYDEGVDILNDPLSSSESSHGTFVRPISHNSGVQRRLSYGLILKFILLFPFILLLMQCCSSIGSLCLKN